MILAVQCYPSSKFMLQNQNRHLLSRHLIIILNDLGGSGEIIFSGGIWGEAP